MEPSHEEARNGAIHGGSALHQAHRSVTLRRSGQRQKQLTRDHSVSRLDKGPLTGIAGSLMQTFCPPSLSPH